MRKFVRLILSKTGIRSLINDRNFRTMMSEWKSLSDAIVAPVKIYKNNNFLILTPAPLYLTSSKGDEAMLLSTIGWIRAHHPDANIVAATASDLVDVRAKALGVQPARVLETWSLQDSLSKISILAPANVVVIGADVMDGGYNPSFSLRLIALGDLAARNGANVRFLGFSFKKKPYKGLAEAYNRVHKSVKFFLRDPYSYERFKKNNSATNALAADIAFLIKGKDTANSADYTNWIKERRAEGGPVFGVNIHHSLLTPDRRHLTRKLVSSFAQLLKSVQVETKASFLLLKHDFGDTNGDFHCLDPLYEMLNDGSMNVRIQSAELSAQEMKRIVKDLDGVISARMHLAIASLGAGTPVFGLNYQDKMEGLFAHFAMDEKFYADVDSIMDLTARHKIIEFARIASKTKIMVESKIEDVSTLSASNFQ